MNQVEVRDGDIGMTLDIYAFHDSCGTFTTKMCHWRIVKNKTAEPVSVCAWLSVYGPVGTCCARDLSSLV